MKIEATLVSPTGQHINQVCGTEVVDPDDRVVDVGLVLQAWAAGLLERRIVCYPTDQDQFDLESPVPALRQTVLNNCFATVLELEAGWLGFWHEVPLQPATAYKLTGKTPVETSTGIPFWTTYALGRSAYLLADVVRVGRTVARQDSETAKKVLDGAASAVNDTLHVKQFTPVALATLRDQLWRWRLNDVLFCGNVDTFARLWQDLKSEIGGVRAPQLRLSDVAMGRGLFRLLDLPTYCTGTTGDVALWCVLPAECQHVTMGRPQVAALATHSNVNVELKHLLQGTRYHGMCCTNSRGVAVARLAT